MKAAVSILLRVKILKVPIEQPIGVFHLQSKNGTFKKGFTFLQNTDVTDEMHATCLCTYPDKQHYMHINYMLIMVHSV